MAPLLLSSPSTITLLLLVVAPPLVFVGIWRWWFTDYSSKVLLPGRLATGEPLLVPYRIPWLGHSLSFMSDINGFVAWVRSLLSTTPAATVQIAGRHLYLIFDPKLASQVYRRSRTFVFDPFNLMVWEVVGASREDMRIARMGAQVVNNNNNKKKDKKKKKKGPDGDEDDDGRRILHDLHTLASIHLSGEALDELTKRFIETLCEDIDRRFPPRNNKDNDDDGDDNEWEILDLCTYVKSTWTHASITALFGSNIHTLWPDIDTWLWDFDAHFQKIVSRMPRFLFPRAYALRDEGQRMCMLWEEEALRAEKEGKISYKIEGDNENDGALWDPYWGHRYTRLRAKRMMENGISARGRAGNAISLLWGLNANAIPVAMQVINQAVLNPSSLLTDLLAEISTCQTGPVSFDMSKITAQLKLRSVYLEALRWATASPSPRVVREDCELEGCGYRYRFRANSMVIVHSRTLQMDPATWEIPGRPESDPVRFWAGRFVLDEDGDKDDDTNTNTNTNDGEAERLDEIAEAEAEYIADTTTTTVAITSTNNNNNNTNNDKLSPVTNERILIKPISSGPKPKSSTKTDTTTPQKQQQQQRLSSLRPYGGGTTLCPGRYFATNEILGGLAALLLRLEIEVIEEELVRNGVPQPDLMKQGGLFPDRPLMVRVRRRRRSRVCT